MIKKLEEDINKKIVLSKDMTFEECVKKLINSCNGNDFLDVIITREIISLFSNINIEMIALKMKIEDISRKYKECEGSKNIYYNRYLDSETYIKYLEEKLREEVIINRRLKKDE